MAGFSASVVATLVELRNLATALVLSAFLALFLRALVLLLTDRGHGALVVALRALSGSVFLALGSVYALFTAHQLVWDRDALLMGLAAFVLVFSGVVFRKLARRAGPSRPGFVPFLLQVIALLLFLLVAVVTLMWAGFLSLTKDRPVLVVDVTGESRMQAVRWAPPDQPLREEGLSAHRVVFRTVEGAPVAEAWIYGDQVAVKGRVLRLSPFLSAAGLPSLFELQFAHNGYLTAERHNTYPHVAVPLPPIGPLAVHPWWRPVQVRILTAWERRTADGGDWAVRSVTTESTYYPLLDPAGRPVRRQFRLVLTPGGLSSS